MFERKEGSADFQAAGKHGAGTWTKRHTFISIVFPHRAMRRAEAFFIRRAREYESICTHYRVFRAAPISTSNVMRREINARVTAGGISAFSRCAARSSILSHVTTFQAPPVPRQFTLLRINPSREREICEKSCSVRILAEIRRYTSFQERRARDSRRIEVEWQNYRTEQGKSNGIRVCDRKCRISPTDNTRLLVL